MNAKVFQPHVRARPALLFLKPQIFICSDSQNNVQFNDHRPGRIPVNVPVTTMPQDTAKFAGACADTTSSRCAAPTIPIERQSNACLPGPGKQPSLGLPHCWRELPELEMVYLIF